MINLLYLFSSQKDSGKCGKKSDWRKNNRFGAELRCKISDFWEYKQKKPEKSSIFALKRQKNGY
ncbi:MAG: hypothetical protein IKX18_09010 [Muribaculaceae bacterium]|nr:hypothetical protein [Muribaculaceae bacterium]MBR5686275.1 hypothetical protein [Muribaculaceae bacterium]